MRMTGRMWWGVSLIVLGILFVLDEQSTFHFSRVLFSLWPLAMVGAGVYLIMRSRRPVDESSVQTAPLADIGIGHRVEETVASSVRLANIFGDVRSRVGSQVFTGGSISTVFGRAMIDLTSAALAPGEQALKLDSVLGSVVVRVPKGMAYAVTADGVAGTVRAGGAFRNGFFPSLTFTSDGYREASHRVRLDLSTVLGEVRVDVEGE